MEKEDKQLNYWREQLAGASALLELPTDYPRPAVQNYRGAHHSVEIPPKLSTSLHQLSHEQGVTLYMTLLGAFVTLLYRYSGQSNIIVGSPIAGRNRQEINGLIGFFVNTLVLRTDLSGNPSFRELLQRVRQVTLSAYNHQDVPFSKLVEQLNPERSLSYHPLFQVMFVLQNPSQPSDKLLGLNATPVEVETTTAKFDLVLSVQPRDDRLIATWEYNSDLFAPGTITRMGGHLQTLLESIVTNPQQSIATLPLLTGVQQQQLLFEWNNTKAEYAHNKCIHQLFEEQVELTPDAVAVVFEQQQLTYQQLNTRANQLAHYLQKLGVQPDVIVGICSERSLEMIVGLLAILKAGGAYLPLDPNYPPQRLGLMVEDAGISLLLTQEKLRSRLPQINGTVLSMDSNWSEIAKESEDNPVSGVNPSNLAYVIYTSGSTGKPKGVLVPHIGLGNLAVVQTKEFNLSSHSRILQFASFSFDASISEIVMTLCSGGSLYLAKSDSLLPGQDLVEILQTKAITHVTLPPSALAVMPTDRVLTLKSLIVAGEVCSPELVATWSTGRRFFNAYGPTESTVCATIAECTNTKAKPPIGRPISNIQVYILDSYLQPVPIGVPGELHISGVGLARGYLNCPELTVEKFIPNPFDPSKSSRLYKTGDLVRYLSDGNIEFLGRIDHQVKIRGFRIELGEIQTVLQQHLEIREAVVIDREDRLGNKRLVAYIVAETDLTDISELRSFLSKKLPDYMIPNAFVKLNALPLTPNGKLDRQALPLPEQSRETITDKLAQPRTAIEKTLAQIWAEVLGLEKIGIDENFFELGGDSILSIQIVAKANQLGWKVTPKQILQNQTIAELANVVTPSSLVEADRDLILGEVPLTPIQEWFFAQAQSEPHHFNQAVLLEVNSDVKPELLVEVIRELLHHHDALRLKFVKNDLGWQQINTPVAEILPFTTIDLSNLETEKQKTAIESIASELQGSLNITEGLIIKATLFNLGEDKPSRLLLIIHHLAVDGVSWRILLEDLATAYQQLNSGEAIQLPAKTTSFQYWAKKLKEYGVASTKLLSELDYWLSQCSSQTLPVDYPFDKSLNTVASAVDVSVSLNEAETHVLLQEVPKAYNTRINDVLLTALVQSFTQWTGESSLLIDLEGHGREELFEDVDLSRTVGWFTTIYPLLLQIDPNSPPGEVLKSIKEQLRCVPQNGIGYGILRYLSQEKEISNQLKLIPQAEVSFNYLGQLDRISSLNPILGFAEESSGLLYAPQLKRNHLLEINAFIKSGRLQINWTYSKEIHKHSTITNLAQRFKESLQSLITHCLSPLAGGYTPSDFPLAKLSASQLEYILNTTGQNIEDIYPLSPPQQDIFCYQINRPKNRSYFIQCTFTIEGELNRSAWKQAWEKVLAIHSILRTSFLWQDLDEPLQIVHKSVNLPWINHDWKSLSQIEQEKNLEDFLKRDRNQGVALDQTPLMRCTLIHLNEREYRFIWSHHHISLDGWSFPIILQQVFTFYEAFNQGKEFSWGLPISYKNYIAWLNKQNLPDAQSFWAQKLENFDFSNLLSFKLPISNSNKQTHKYQAQYINLSASLTSTLQSIAQQHHFTLSTLFQGLWAILIYKYSGHEDILLGNTISGRSIPMFGIESMVGLFSSVLPVRINISTNTKLIPWLQQLYFNQVEMEQYADSSLKKIREWCNISSKLPLFESLIAFENYPLTGIDFLEKMSLQISNIQVIGLPRMLEFFVFPKEELSLGIQYYCHQFERDTISQIVQDLQILLQKIAANPHQLIRDLL